MPTQPHNFMETLVKLLICPAHIIYPPYSYISNLFIKSLICSIIRFICKLKSRKSALKGDISSSSTSFMDEGSLGFGDDEILPNRLDKSLTSSLSCVNDVSFMLSCVCITALVSHSPCDGYLGVILSVVISYPPLLFFQYIEQFMQ